MKIIDEKIVGGILIAKGSCRKCYGRGFYGYELEIKLGKWEQTGRVFPCKCLRKVANRELIMKGWKEVITKKKEEELGGKK